MALELKKTRVIESPDWASVAPLLSALNEPVIFKGLIRDWPLVQKGLESDQKIMDYILSFYTGAPLPHYRGSPEMRGKYHYSADGRNLNFQSVRGQLDNVFDEIAQAKGMPEPPAFYVGSTTIDSWLPGMRADNDIKFSDVDPLVSIWMSNRSTVPAHFDAPDNVACCVAGKRRFTMFPPHQLENLYVGPIHFTPAGQTISLVDFENPDWEKYPRFRTALESAEVAELEPGDALFVPSMWWHHVEATSDFNVLVNYWWRDSKLFMDPPMDALSHAILCIRDLAPKEKAVWRDLFDYYVFSDDQAKFDHIPEGARGFLDPLDDMNARRLRTWLIGRLNK